MLPLELGHGGEESSVLKLPRIYEFASACNDTAG